MSRYFNYKTGEIYDGTVTNLIAHSMRDYKCFRTLYVFAWAPYNLYFKTRRQHISMVINHVCCAISLKFPRLYRPLRWIALCAMEWGENSCVE